ncbi:hypothetical protein I41_24360 [Lacipirellula limnantheis]|uniref:Uncharacterized protein n=1 Tax=Lacipirellula limnantheis TaxID=2528024 RepID=A0A517TY05_9BACT|nr:hypothetical protein I41_24360 [Lacipirellula limnantheis]
MAPTQVHHKEVRDHITRFFIVLFSFITVHVNGSSATIANNAALQPRAKIPWNWTNYGEPALLRGGSNDYDLFH